MQPRGVTPRRTVPKAHGRLAVAAAQPTDALVALHGRPGKRMRYNDYTKIHKRERCVWEGDGALVQLLRSMCAVSRVTDLEKTSRKRPFVMHRQTSRLR